MIGRDNEAMIAHPNEHMCYEMAKLNERPFVTAGAVNQLHHLFAAMLLVTQSGSAEGEMRYHVSRIKSVGDISRLTEAVAVQIPGLISVIAALTL